MRYYDLARGRKPRSTGGETKIRLSTNIIISYEKCAPEGVRSTPSAGAFFMCCFPLKCFGRSPARHSFSSLYDLPLYANAIVKCRAGSTSTPGSHRSAADTDRPSPVCNGRRCSCRKSPTVHGRPRPSRCHIRAHNRV